MQLIEDSLKQDASKGEALKILLSISTDHKSLEMIAKSKGIISTLIALATEDKSNENSKECFMADIQLFYRQHRTPSNDQLRSEYRSRLCHG